MKVLLLDGYNLFYRARYSGMNKGDYSTIFNFFRGLRPLIEKMNPDISYLVLEGMPKKRLSMSPDYKGQRKYNDDDNFRSQRKEIVNILHSYFPITLVKHEDYECDDIIGHLAKENENLNNEVTIISSDTDFIQCISDKVKLYNPVRKQYIDKPSYDYVLWKSLKGDDSDNIIGFKGIGNKKAQKLCENKPDLDKFLLNEENKEKLNHNIEMITLHNLKEEANNIKFYNTIERPKWNELKEVFEKYNFNSIVSKDSTWNKYTNTFKNLWENLNVS
jgi:DNA polymerase-1